MALSVNPLTYVISVPQSDLTLVSGTLYTLDTDQFRKDLKDWEDSEEGIIQPKTHDHNTELTVGGVTYSRAVTILAPYSIEFENGLYSVRLEGSNNNIWDIQAGILVQNTVQVIPTNSAGLQTVVSGSGVLPADITAIAAAVWDKLVADHDTAGTFGAMIGVRDALCRDMQAAQRRSQD